LSAADKQKRELFMTRTASILEKLNLEPLSLGACAGVDCWIDTGATPIPSVNPADGSVLGHVRPADAGAYEQVQSRAADAFDRWRRTPAPVRGELIRDLGCALREVKEPLGELVTLEMGKIRQEGLGEVQEMIDICDFATGLSRQLYGRTMHSERPMHRMYEQWHPLGVIGVISSFNFPVAVWSWNVAVASVAGNTVIWKPSPSTPLTAVAVQRVCNQVMADHHLSGLFNLVVDQTGELGDRMASDPALPLISFTGSTATGRKVAEKVAIRFGKSLLELGGNNAVIATENADLDLLIPAVLFGAVGTAGQRCTSTRRLIVHADIIDTVIERLIHTYRQVSIGNPMASGTLMGPLHSEAAVQKMAAALEQATAEGGEIRFGGDPLPELGPRYVTPAIVRMPSQTPVVKKETFAPILYVISFETMDDAVALNNGVPQGLSSSIFTKELREAEQFLSHLGSDCGIANVNIGTSGAEIGGAFGGEKETGGGREAGSDAWKAYMRLQTNTINWSAELPLAQGISFGVK
jgi:aldehyde dehydrogenase (NAD+)